MTGTSPKIPPPPDPYALADAQGRVNIQAAEQQHSFGRTNIASPYGSVSWEQTPGYDPAGENLRQQRADLAARAPQIIAGHAGTDIPIAQRQIAENLAALDAQIASSPPSGTGASRYTQRITLSPEEQAAYAGQHQIGAGMRTAALDRLGRIGSQQPLNFEGLRDLGSDINVGPLSAEGLPTLGGDYEDSRRIVQEAMLSRVEPDFARQRSALEARMAEQGIPMGSTQYSTGMDEVTRAMNDARMQAVLAGGQEQSRLLGEARADRGQLFGERGAVGEFDMRRRQQEIAEAMQERQQGIAERTQLYNQPYQELQQFMGGIAPAQVPQALPTPNVQIAPGDITNVAMGNYNRQVEQAQQDRTTPCRALG